MAADLDVLRHRLREFATAREWERFHTPKNLMMALVGEAGEAAAVIQWLSDAEIDALLAVPETRRALEDELADVLIYLVRLADVCNIDVVDAADRKIAVNEAKYPVDLARGHARKYTTLGVEEPT